MPDFAAKTIIVMGDTGHGKSALIKNLQTKLHAKMYGVPKVAKNGGNAQGTTKDQHSYQCKIGPHDVMMYDTPGLGDPTVQISKTLADIEDRIVRRGVDLVIVCHDVTQDNTTNNFMAAKHFIEALDVGKTWDSKWDRVLLVGTKLDRRNLMVKAGLFTQEAVDSSWQEKVDLFFEESDGPRPNILIGYYADAKKQQQEIIDMRGLQQAILRSKCFGKKGVAPGGRSLKMTEKWNNYIQSVVKAAGRNEKEIKALYNTYRKQKEVLEGVMQDNAALMEKLALFEKEMKKRKKDQEARKEKFLKAKAELIAQTVPELKDICVAEGIKTAGVGWPACCPPDGLKESIVNCILAKKYID